MPGRRSKKPPPRPVPSRFSHTPSRAAPRGPAQFPPSGGFTMRDEARNTASHHGNWGKDAKLRDNPVAFVSSGFGRPLDDLETELSPRGAHELIEGDADDLGSETGLRDTAAVTTALESEIASPTPSQTAALPPIAPLGMAQQLDGFDDAERPESASVPARDQENLEPKPPSIDASVFFFDLSRDQSREMPQCPPPQVVEPRSPSISPNDSGEDILLFKGRNWHAAQRAKARSGDAGLRQGGKMTGLVKKTFPAAASGSGGPAGQCSDAMRELVAVDDMCTDGSPAVLSNSQEAAGASMPSGKIAENRFDDTEDDSESREDDDVGVDMDADLDDETLARLLSRREGLDMGNDIYLSLSDSEANHQRTPASRKSGYTKNVGKFANSQPPGARAVAKAFDELSLSDIGGQFSYVGSSRIRTKKVPPHFNVSDSELEHTLQAAWLNDRQRKKTRKVQREEMRKQGLLGKHADPDDLRVKYHNSIKLDEIKLELKAFLCGSDESIQFPPLDKHARKIVHELASKFKIKSQSMGSGNQRRPVLYRTKTTARYARNRSDDAMRHIEEAAARIHRKCFPRTGTEPPAMKKTNAGRSSHAAATYREGEIVGASIPEIGQSNKGRTMLEKMGWSRGMGLGSEDNKGILEPVAQVVKRSKAGLG